MDARFHTAWTRSLGALERHERGGALAGVTGHVAESVVEVLLADIGYHPVWHFTGPGRHGVDLLMASPTLDHVLAIEVKGSLRAGSVPRLSRRAVTQMSAAWVDKRDNPGMAEWELQSADVYGAVIAVSFAEMVVRAIVSDDFADVASRRGAGGPRERRGRLTRLAADDGSHARSIASQQLRGGELGADLEQLRVGVGAVERREQRVEDAPVRDDEALAGGERVARAFAARCGTAAARPAPRGGQREALPFLGRAGERSALLERGDASQVARGDLGFEAGGIVGTQRLVGDERAQVGERRVQPSVCVVEGDGQRRDARRGGGVRTQRAARPRGGGGREHGDLTPFGQVVFGGGRPPAGGATRGTRPWRVPTVVRRGGSVRRPPVWRRRAAPALGGGGGAYPAFTGAPASTTTPTRAPTGGSRAYAASRRSSVTAAASGGRPGRRTSAASSARSWRLARAICLFVVVRLAPLVGGLA